jgi:electron transfer flavoprotein beta subunit
MGIAALSSPPDMGRDCQFLEGSVDDQAEKLAEVFMSLRDVDVTISTI